MAIPGQTLLDAVDLVKTVAANFALLDLAFHTVEPLMTVTAKPGATPHAGAPGKADTIAGRFVCDFVVHVLSPWLSSAQDAPSGSPIIPNCEPFRIKKDRLFRKLHGENRVRLG
ncbi:MAG: hypothetical protein KJ630_22810 [Proteobacteria bacterium]|nr:hypothetical protein [Pseudomonadota bacterium]